MGRENDPEVDFAVPVCGFSPVDFDESDMSVVETGITISQD
jgi:hypothetical protein